MKSLTNTTFLNTSNSLKIDRAATVIFLDTFALDVGQSFEFWTKKKDFYLNFEGNIVFHAFEKVWMRFK